MKSRILLIVLIICIGCTSNKKEPSPEDKIISDLNKKYESLKEFFGSKMVNHLPEKVNENTITFTECLSPELGNLELIFINKGGSKLAETIKEFECNQN